MKDEALKLIERLVNEADLCRNEGANDIAALLDEAAKALAAPVQEPVAWRWVPSKVWQDYVLSDDPQKAALAREHGIEVEALCKCTTPPAAQRPDVDALVALARADEREAFNKERQQYADWLDEAAADIEDWGMYASEYLQKKWDLPDQVQDYKNRAAAIRARGNT
jgi:hypothetical protein